MNPASPFSPRMALALVAGGAALFLSLLVMVGTGIGGDGTNNGGAHGAGRGLNGFAALARLVEAEAYSVSLARHGSGLAAPGLLVLTPPAEAEGKAIDKLVSAHRHIGPTLVITPKWQTQAADPAAAKTKKGWVSLTGIQPPRWQGFLDDVSLNASPLPQGRWTGSGASGPLPEPRLVFSGKGNRLVPLVTGRGDGRILAAAVDDNGTYPLIMVFEPDLLDNYGMAHSENAVLASNLIAAAFANGPASKAPRQITFDLTLNGLARTPNLLTLAFTPPFLAATLCLLFAAFAAGWRAFARFGPAREEDRDLAFGKTALVENTAALIRRARRLTLLPAPYVEAARGRIARALGLPRLSGATALDAAIDRALASRQTGTVSPPFSETAAKLLAAHGQTDLLRAASDLHALERKLTR